MRNENLDCCQLGYMTYTLLRCHLPTVQWVHNDWVQIKSFILKSKTRGPSYLTRSPNKASFLIGWRQNANIRAPPAIYWISGFTFFPLMCLFLDSHWILIVDQCCFTHGRFVENLLLSLLRLFSLSNGLSHTAWTFSSSGLRPFR